MAQEIPITLIIGIILLFVPMCFLPGVILIIYSIVIMQDSNQGYQTQPNSYPPTTYQAQ